MQSKQNITTTKGGGFSKYYESKIIVGNALHELKKIPNNSINLIITSPPYWKKRQYGVGGLGEEPDPRDYIRNILKLTKEMMRVLRPDGSLYLNVSDSYFSNIGFHRRVETKEKFGRKYDSHYKGLKIAEPDGRMLQKKQQLMLPSRIAIGMQDVQGWILRNDIVWHKNALPNMAGDRRMPTHEYVFHFIKSNKERIVFDGSCLKGFGQHLDVVKCSIERYKGHQATFPLKLVIPMVLSSSREGDIVLDPFAGSGTTLVASTLLKRKSIGIELNVNSCKIASKNIKLSQDIALSGLNYRSNYDIEKMMQIYSKKRH